MPELILAIDVGTTSTRAAVLAPGGAILGLAASTSHASALKGTVLATAYCIGLGIPFVLAAVATERAAIVTRAIRRHAVGLMRFGGIVLVVIGILEVTGAWTALVTLLQDHFGSVSIPL